MSRYSIFDSTIKTLFDKIRAKTGKTEKMSFTEAGEAVDSIKSADAKPYIDTSQITDFSYFFYRGARKEMADRVDTSSGTKFDYLYQSSFWDEIPPAINTEAGTSFKYTFNEYGCADGIPLINTSNGINFQYMFASTNNSINTPFDLPYLNTAKGKNFYGMFWNSYVRKVTDLNTSSGTDFTSMFSGCSYLTQIPALDTSNGTTFASMFRGARHIKTIPKLNTNKGTSFYDMFASCGELEEVGLTYIATLGANNTFYHCSNLKMISIDNILVNGNSLNLSYCPKLSHDSLVGILNACSDNSELSETYYITLGSTNLAKLSAEEQAIATNKNIELR